MSTALRRLITVPALLAATLLASVTLPLWLPLLWLVGAVGSWRGIPRLAMFLFAYLWCETIGIVVSFAIWACCGFCRRGSARYSRFLDANFVLQCEWANALKSAGQRIFDLRFRVTGTDALDGPPVLLLPRHVSGGDTVIPIVFYARPCRRRLRYVMKRELLIDPCLDIVGHRLPNYFVDRGAADSEREIQGILGLLTDPGDDGILIYPEGTRFTEAKRSRILSRLDPASAARARVRTHVLPPRPRGTLALLAHNPGLDLLFCAHSGLEDAASVSALVSGSAVGAEVRIHFWRIPFAAIPDADAQPAFLLDCWDRMDREVARLATARAVAGAAPHSRAAAGDTAE